jgi:uncharacterized membrane protein
MKTFLPQFIAMTATGLLAGAFMYGFLNVVPTFSEVPVKVHLIYRVQLMNHNSMTMQFLMGVSIIASLWYAVVYRHSLPVMSLAILAAALALTSLLVTRFGNVPINQIIKTWPPDQPPANWTALLHTWDRYNLIRTLTSIGCFISFIMAAHWASFS